MTDLLPSAAGYSPAQAVERAGCSLDTLRYYERIGLLSVERDAGGRRRYTDGDLDWIGLLRCLRETGMPIARMQEYATTAEPDEVGTARRRLAILEQHAGQVEEDLARLLAQRARLRDKLDWYRGVVEAAEGVDG